ncbi:unnamed protein product [Clonostachys rosea]|uniref:Uncharacterized protein n=1 Tax=Bionectria ochroleuca TaxID=29856 RepID=A0ABY6U7M2_BIOOC|nr:unnamed protein product [Clonostachys rosea]
MDQAPLAVKFKISRTPSGFSEIITKADSEDRTVSRSSRTPTNSGGEQDEELLALRLEMVSTPDNELERLLSVFGDLSQEVLAFEPQLLDSNLTAELQSQRHQTFISPFFDWVRLPSKSRQDPQPRGTFFWRVDAQKLALALLSIPWHPQGYLIGGKSSGYCFQLLESSACDFLYLLIRIQENVANINVDLNTKAEIKKSLALVEKMVRREQSSAMLLDFSDFCQLNDLLIAAGHTNLKINDMIGVLMITNEEFASYSIVGSVTIEMRTGYVKVPLPFGGMQDYPIDMNELYEGWKSADQTIVVDYTIVILACLRASMRSYLLNIRHDGHPLARAVLELNDTAYMA